LCGACYEQQRPSQQRAGEWTSSYIDAAPVPSIKIFDATTKKLLAVPIPDSAHRTALADRTPAPVETARRQLTELIKVVECPRPDVSAMRHRDSDGNQPAQRENRPGTLAATAPPWSWRVRLAAAVTSRW